MTKKRLKNALNAGKLIRLGFNLNNSKPEKLDLLYQVNCLNDRVEFAEEKASLNQKFLLSKPKIEINSESDSDSLELSDDFDKQTGSKSEDDDEKVEILCVQFNQNLNLLATGDSNGIIKIYDIFAGCAIGKTPTIDADSNFKKYFANVKKFSTSFLSNMPTICMKWHPYSNYSMNFLYFANVNGYIGVLDKESLEKHVIIEEKDEIACIDFNLDGTCLASVGKDYIVKLYDSNLNNSATLNRLTTTYGPSDGANNNPGTSSNKSSIFSNIASTLSSILMPSLVTPNSSTSHTNRIQAVKFSNTSNDVFFTGGWDRSVKIWDKRTPNGFVNSINGPFICGSDAIDVNDNMILTASWVKENALEIWDIRTCNKRIATLNIVSNLGDPNGKTTALKKKELGKNEYLYACKFFSSCNHSFENENGLLESSRSENTGSTRTNYSTVLACGSGTQSLHLIDYELQSSKQHLASINCQSPLYCLDSIYSCSLIACGGMRKFFTMMASSTED